MKRLLTVLLYSITFLAAVTTLTNCSKDDPKPKPTKITGNVTDFDTGSALADVSVVLFDADSKAPVGTALTDAAGDFEFTIEAGNYFLKFYKQGYISVPPPGIDPVPFSVAAQQTVDKTAEMIPSAVTDAGSISGTVKVGTTGKIGVLVVAQSGGEAYSAVSDADGNFSIFNVPAATYDVIGHLSGFSSTTANTTVAVSTESSGVDITLTEGVSGSVAGSFKVISATTILSTPSTMDISLIHPITRETIPGLSQDVTYGSSINFSFSNVPDGDYIVRASYVNDYIVIDPDYITKFGDYAVSVSGGTPTPASVDIVSTGAVLLSSPTNEMTTTVPVAATATPTFSWNAYASTSDYVIEVTDAATGNVIWGGFSSNGTVKNITIPSNTTSVTFDFDGSASASLEVGRVYRWRIYASKNDVAAGTWNLISASEDQMGLIKIE